MLLMPGFDKNSLRSNNCLSPGNRDKALSATYTKKISHLLAKKPAPGLSMQTMGEFRKGSGNQTS